jgi:hypothetical protein
MPVVDHTPDRPSLPNLSSGPREHHGGTVRDLMSVGIGVLALAGMAYCHAKDVGEKFDEHVYYMAILFVCNVAGSIASIALLLVTRRAPTLVREVVWFAAGLLALLTIVGFVWSRTIGFPQMEDHVGRWDTLGLTSVAFELLIAGVSGWMLVLARRACSYHASDAPPLTAWAGLESPCVSRTTDVVRAD